jgi:hypothetical protein
MNYSSMTEEEIAKLTAIEKKQPVWQQLQALTDIADISQELLNVADSAKKESKAQIQALGAVLTDAREQLVELNKKEAPEAPDYAKPVVDAVAKLESAIKSLDLKPKITLPAPIVDLKSPDVNVSAPDVKIDLKPLEKLLKVDIPKAFKESIALIPTPEKDDNTAMLESLAEMNDWLKSIDTVARKKPLLGTAASSGGGGGAGTQYADGAARGTATGTIAMGDDGTNIQSIKTDSSGVLAIQDNGGSITVDGTITANAGTNLNTSALALDATLTGGSQTTRITNGTNTAAVKASSTAAGATDPALVVAISPNNTVAATQSGTWNVTNVSGTVSLPTGAATSAAQTDKSQFTKLTDGTDTALITAAGEQNVIATAQPGVDIGDVTINNASGASAVNIQDGGNSITVDQPTGTNLHTVIDSGTITTVGAVTNITNAIPVNTTTTSTHSNVANSITSVTLLSLNTSRKSATIYNDDTAASLYVKFGTTASATSFKIKIAPGGYYEFPLPIYTGRVDGIATAATGTARICEET